MTKFFSQFHKNCKPRNPGISIKTKQDNHKKHGIKAYNDKITEDK